MSDTTTSIPKENKRKLTEEEMYEITDFLQIDPEKDWEAATSVLENTRLDLFRQMKDVEIYPSKIQDFKKIIEKTYFKSLAEGGHSLGVDAALAIGEPTTQLTLNSIDYNEYITILINNDVRFTKIGTFIDNYMENYREFITIYDECTEYVGISGLNIKTPCVDENGKTHWKLIEAVTRHPPPNGEKLIKVTTESGRVVRATKSKSFLTRVNNKIIPTKGSDIKIGDRLPITVKLPHPLGINDDNSKTEKEYLNIIIENKNFNIELSYDFGFFLSFFLFSPSTKFSDYLLFTHYETNIREKLKSFLLANQVQHMFLEDYIKLDSDFVNLINDLTSDKKSFPDFVLSGNFQLMRGIIDGIVSNYKNCEYSLEEINIIFPNELICDCFINIMNIFGIFCHRVFQNDVYKLSIRYGNYIKFVNTFKITVDSVHEFFQRIKDKKSLYTYNKEDYVPIRDFNIDTERDIIIHRDSIVNKSLYNLDDCDVIFDRIIIIEEVEATGGIVYDLTVKDTKNFNLTNGLCCRDTFHLAGCGSANVTLGVPRLNEILNASKNQKTSVMKLKLVDKDKKYKTLQDVRDKCRVLFEEKYVDQCIDSHEIFSNKYDNLSEEEEEWYECFNIIFGEEYKRCEWCLRLVFNKLVMYQYKLTLQNISKIIEKEYNDCFCVFSSDDLGIIDVYVDTTNLDCPEDILLNKKSRKSRKNIDDDIRKTINPLITDENKEYYFMKYLVVDYILNIKLNGIEGITKIFYNKDIKTGEWNIETSGTNMREVMNIEDVDYRTVISNNMWEIFGILGIEAVRHFLINEITSIISFGGTFVDPAHPTLLADSMTSTGTISSVNRYGIGKGVGVFTSASFEQSHQTMLDAPIKGMVDDLKTVSAAIIMGKRMPNGTGYFDLLADINKLKLNKNKKDNRNEKCEKEEDEYEIECN